MAFRFIEALSSIGVSRMTAGRIYDACARVHASEGSLRLIAQCASRGIVDKQDVLLLKRNKVIDSDIRRSKTFPIHFNDLVELIVKNN